MKHTFRIIIVYIIVIFFSLWQLYWFTETSNSSQNARDIYLNIKQERNLAWENNLEERVLSAWEKIINSMEKYIVIIRFMVFIIISIPFLILYRRISEDIDKSNEKLISDNDTWDSPRLNHFIDKNDPKNIDALKELLSKEDPRLYKTKIKDNIKWRHLILWTNIYLSEIPNPHTVEFIASNWVLFLVWKFQDFQDKKDFILSHMYDDIKLWYKKNNETSNNIAKYGIQAAFVTIDVFVYNMLIYDFFPIYSIIAVPFLYIAFITYKNMQVLNSHPDIRESIKRYYAFEWDHEDIFPEKHDKSRHLGKQHFIRKGMTAEANRLYDFIQLK